ncbi:MAG: c-type cytochrome [Anaerolineaceae bacterium]|nr:c-type cytochrome [Anaerolineaceae bacterium]
MTAPSSASTARWPVYLVIGLFVLVTIIFLGALALTTESELVIPPTVVAALTADTYMDKVSVLLQNADASRGALLVEQHGCTACHREGAVNKIAPSYDGIAERAATRRPPLTAAAYIYESITNPLAFVVEGYNPSMPQNFSQQLSDQELGDIIAYLLTPTAH